MTRSLKRRNDLNDTERLHLYFMLVEDFNGKKLIHGSIKKYAELFSVSRKTVGRIWELGSKFIDNGDVIDVKKKLSKHVGRKRLEIDIEKVKEIPLHRCKTIASLAHSLQVSKSIVHRRVKEGKQDVLDGLSETQSGNLGVEQLVNNLSSDFSCLNIHDRSEFTFLEMFDHVVKDEKLFYMSKEMEKYYLTTDEIEPCRSCKSKRFITKVMFLAAVAKPRFNEAGDVIFDGKIRIFPFIYQQPAKRRSKNRVAGTLETKPIEAVTQDISRLWLIEKVLPAIRDRWPMDSRCSTIFIQQDNARPHIKPFDNEFIEAAKIDGFDIKLKCQPPNSPDLNVLELGYFRAIQALQYQEAPKTIDELVVAVEKSCTNLSANTLNRVFLTLQECMIEVMKTGGGNNYKIPHTRKEKLEREGLLPLTLKCNDEILRQAISHLQS